MPGLLALLAATVIAAGRHHLTTVARRQIRGVVPPRYSHCRTVPRRPYDQMREATR